MSKDFIDFSSKAYKQMKKSIKLHSSVSRNLIQTMIRDDHLSIRMAKQHGQEIEVLARIWHHWYYIGTGCSYQFPRHSENRTFLFILIFQVIFQGPGNVISINSSTNIFFSVPILLNNKCLILRAKNSNMNNIALESYEAHLQFWQFILEDPDTCFPVFAQGCSYRYPTTLKIAAFTSWQFLRYPGTAK